MRTFITLLLFVIVPYLGLAQLATISGNRTPCVNTTVGYTSTGFSCPPKWIVDGGTIIGSNIAFSVQVRWNDVTIGSLYAYTGDRPNCNQDREASLDVRVAECRNSGSCQLKLYRDPIHSNVVKIDANCDYCVTFDVYFSGGTSFGNRLQVIPPGTTVTYSGAITNITIVSATTGFCPSGSRAISDFSPAEGDLELQNEADVIKTYPNPVTDDLIVISDIEIQNYDLINSAGTRVKSDMKDNVINLSGLPSGIYYLRLATKNGLTFKRVVKK
jgi:hypothetical protein